MAKKKLKSDFSEQYENYRKLDLKIVQSVDPASFGEAFEAADKTLKMEQRDRKNVGVAIKLATKVAHQCDLETFNHFMETGEVPPIKISKEEMTLLKGGKGLSTFQKFILGGVAIAGAVAVGYTLYKGLNKPTPAPMPNYPAGNVEIPRRINPNFDPDKPSIPFNPQPTGPWDWDLPTKKKS